MGHTIYLVGARAAGKTTFGGALARQLGCNYVDTDIHLRETTGETVADIVAREGWDGFRKRESAVLRAVTTPGTVIAQFWIFHVTREGVITAVAMMLRISLLIMGTFLLTYTTSPIRLTDGLEDLLGPLKKLGVPVHELAMMMSIALRFIPTLIEETDKIMSAQRARGADFESGNLLQRAKALIPLLVPLFVSAFRRADELATAMECRCYHGGEGRTKLHVLRYETRDYLTLAFYAALCAAMIALKKFF